MSDDRWRQVEELYHAALGLPPEQRAAISGEMRLAAIPSCGVK